MRVLQVVSSLNIGSGIANFILNYYRNVDREKVQFDFLIFFEAEKNYHEEVSRLGGRIFTIPSPSIKTFSKYDKQVKAFFEEHKNEWDCVHIHEILVQKFIIKHAKENGVKKICMHSHVTEFVLEDPSLPLFKRKLQVAIKKLRNKYLLSGFLNKTDYYLACSREAGVALYGEKTVKGERFAVIKNAIDTQKYIDALSKREQTRKTLGVENRKVLINVGRLCEQKNQAFLLKVFEKLHEKDDTYALFLVGEGNDRGALEKDYSHLLQDGSLSLLGNRTDIPSLLACADVFVFPSIMEGLGIALIEAQASGIACISSSAVPKETDITKAVRYLDLSLGEEKWAEEILATPITRYDTKADIIKSGYDVKASALSLQEIYTK